jgi:hypothetical protein
MEFNGLPLHPLIVHVVVVFAPLAAVAGILYAVMPRWRWWLRWPLVATAVISAIAAVIAVKSGLVLENQRHLQAIVATHMHRGRILRWMLIAYLVPTGLGAWFLGGTSPVTSGWGARGGRSGVVGISLQVLLVVLAILVLIWVFLTGDSGARAIWGT